MFVSRDNARPRILQHLEQGIDRLLCKISVSVIVPGSSCWMDPRAPSGPFRELRAQGRIVSSSCPRCSTQTDRISSITKTFIWSFRVHLLVEAQQRPSYRPRHGVASIATLRGRGGYLYKKSGTKIAVMAAVLKSR